VLSGPAVLQTDQKLVFAYENLEAMRIDRSGYSFTLRMHFLFTISRHIKYATMYADPRRTYCTRP
jgi:hypothetical protein